MAFLEYITSLKATLASLGPTTKVCVTLGNASCDLDSIVCALVYAHYKSTSGSSEEVNLPLLQCRGENLVLNQEATIVFDMLGIDTSGLLYVNDVSSDVMSTVAQLSLVLVDHNAPTGTLEPFSSSVVKIIDHHDKSTDSLADKAGVFTTIEMVGSCASLIAREILDDESFTVEESVATLLLSAILLDTGNLKAAKRVTQTDKTAVEELLKLLPSTFNNDDHYSRLFKARFDVSTLSMKQALQKDYKECHVNNFTIGFSSITTLLSDFLPRTNVSTDLAEFHSDHKLNALILVGISIHPTIRRQIAVFQPEGINSDFAESILNVLEENEDLQCKRVEQVVEFTGTILEQGDTDISRKQITPIVLSFVSLVDSEYPQTSQSPPHIMLETAEASAAGAVDQPFPLEPDITILSSPSDEKESTPPRSKKATSKSSAKPKVIPEYSSAEEFKERRSHRIVSVGGEENVISLNMVEPYKKIIQHAGYIGESRQALVVLSACHLPPRSLPNYNHVVHHTFYYILSVLDKLIVDDYTIVYLHSGAPRNSVPSIPVLHRFYRTIDRRLRKQLTRLYIVHPTFWVKTMLRLARPFISTKFWRKVHFIPTLQDLSDHVKLNEEYISAPVVAVDKLVMSRRPSSQKYTTKTEPADAQEDVKEKDQ